MNTIHNRRTSTETLALGALLTALVVVLQFLAIFIKAAVPVLPFTVSLVLIPIVIGAAKCGPAMGGWLGFVFGVIVLLSGDAAAFLTVNFVGTIVTVLVKGTACGLAAGLVYKLLEKKNKYLAVILASITCPIVNTGIFLIGCLVFFLDTVSLWAQGWAESLGYTENILALYMFLGLCGVNFLVEFGTNLILNPVIFRLLNIKKN